MTASDDDLPTQIQPSPAPFDKTRQVAAPTPVPSSAAAMGDGNSLPVGTRLAEFELTRTLGEGGFGIVYLALDHSLHRKVALKEYMPSQLASRGAGTSVSVKAERYRDTFEAGLKSFINEARLLAQFDHPALVKVYRFWEANGTAYMVMPFYEGQTLKDTLKALPGPPDEAWLRGLLIPLSEALKVIHGEQCFHRDIAPDNIILLGGLHTRPLLLDFGAARRVISDMTQALTVILKPGYAPLEQYAEVPHMKQGPWTDIYALAAVVYFAITRRTPPPSVGRMMGDTYQPLSQLVAGRYSASFLHAIDRALSVKPEDRPQSIAQLMAELDQPAPAAQPDDFGLDDDKTVIRPARPGTAPSPALDPLAGFGNPPPAPSSPAPAPRAAAVTSATPAAAAPKSSRTPLYAGLGGLGLVAVGAVAYLSLTSTPPRRGAPDVVAPVVAQSPAPAPSATEAARPASPAPAPEPTPAALAGIDPNADFERILGNQSAGFKVEVAARKTKLRIGHDRLSFTLRSERDGYYHVLALGPDGTLVQLMPNAVLTQHRIKAGETLTLPGPAMPMDVSPPAGQEQLFVVVSATPRDLTGLKIGVDSGLTELAVGSKAAGMLGDQAGRQPAYLGRAACPSSSACSQEYGAARLIFDILP
ncbi:serine/threonine-protein kinase [Roseateles saccharophilus]|uniref:Protein kinase domain-containing protein n=1 Tax=Roseateles saccharophilus TaxID=304 RepID=A0A4R3UZM0_ROSSA|nr:serine/threonine-protein kinase [Roseateles saccharophilus]MDG0835662.1 DUF4384 domain-containing protein [Roseateles saccharophilus]TCU96323.1 hypothetical protein EV671_101390 [Roseateles saccharophilus]